MNIKDLFRDALPTIKEFAPVIASAIGGPFGVAAGYVIPVLATAFGGSSKDVPGLVSKIMSDPDASTKLSLCEEDHSGWLTALMTSVNNLSSAEVNIKVHWH